RFGGTDVLYSKRTWPKLEMDGYSFCGIAGYGSFFHRECCSSQRSCQCNACRLWSLSLDNRPFYSQCCSYCNFGWYQANWPCNKYFSAGNGCHLCCRRIAHSYFQLSANTAYFGNDF